MRTLVQHGRAVVELKTLSGVVGYVASNIPLVALQRLADRLKADFDSKQDPGRDDPRAE